MIEQPQVSEGHSSNPDKLSSVLRYGKFVIFGGIGMLAIIVLAFLFFYLTDDGGKVQDIRITNITGNGATISWVTEEEAYGNVYYSKSNTWIPIFEKVGKDRALDDRDIEENEDGQYVVKADGMKKRVTHHVTIRGLEPETEYFFRVADSLKTFKGTAISFKTFRVEEDVRIPDPVYGKVIDNEGNVLPEGIVYYRVYNKPASDQDARNYTQEYSTTINVTGGWSGDIGYVLTVSGEELSRDEETDTIQLHLKTIAGQEYIDYTLNEYKPLPETIITGDTPLLGEHIQSLSALTNGLITKVNAYMDGCCGGGNVCAMPPSTPGCGPTFPGGYCDPGAPYGDFSDANWTQGYNDCQGGGGGEDGGGSGGTQWCIDGIVSKGQYACNPGRANYEFRCDNPGAAYPWRDIPCPAGQTCTGTRCGGVPQEPLGQGGGGGGGQGGGGGACTGDSYPCGGCGNGQCIAGSVLSSCGGGCQDWIDAGCPVNGCSAQQDLTGHCSSAFQTNFPNCSATVAWGTLTGGYGNL